MMQAAGVPLERCANSYRSCGGPACDMNKQWMILTALFTVRYPMHDDPSYWWPEYACHEDKVIVQNYVETNRYERANPKPEIAESVPVPADIADDLAGRWVGRPRIVTLDLDIELEFTRNGDCTVLGKLIGTNLGASDKPLRGLSLDERRMQFEFANIQPWNFDGEVTRQGTIVGVVTSARGGVPVTFSRVLDGAR